jgi:peptide/nickel transport system ATP-binding protein
VSDGRMSRPPSGSGETGSEADAGEGPLLRVKDLIVSFATEDGTVRAVDGLSYDLAPGEILAIVGESGSGKSVSVMTLMGLTRGVNARFDGYALFRGQDLISAGEEEMERIRGAQIAMIFQDPMTSLDPVYRIGTQIVEQIRAHEEVSKAEARERAITLLDQVGIPRARERVDAYPHELSGGMRQRVMIAMALSCDPSILIADEPTTALDVTIQAQILERIKELRARTNTAVILVTHDLGVVADVADRIIVMYAGRIVEQGTVDEIFYDPQHPYTWGLLGSITRLDRERPRRLPSIPGSPPSLIDPPEGCHFRPRCVHEFDRCREVPALEAHVAEAPEHVDRCWLSVAEKRARREVTPGQIGLARPQEAPA